jgi:hypothetical protein
VRRQRRAPPTTAAQASRTEVVLQPQQQQQQPAAVPKQQQSGWSPWRVVNPFGGAARSTKETQGELVTVSEAQLWQMLETETGAGAVRLCCMHGGAVRSSATHPCTHAPTPLPLRPHLRTHACNNSAAGGRVQRQVVRPLHHHGAAPGEHPAGQGHERARCCAVQGGQD